jgi:hypothetical protein
MMTTESADGSNAALIAEVREAYKRDYDLTAGLRDRLCTAIADGALSDEIKVMYERRYKFTANFVDRICAALSKE